MYTTPESAVISPTHQRRTTASLTRISCGAALAALTFAACGTGSDDTTAVPAPTAAPAPAEQPTPAPVEPTAAPATGAVAKSADTSIGEVLTNANGLTLYGFVNDVDALSTCYGTCADAWPPVIVDAEFSVGPGLDVGFFATTERDDGQLQLVAGKFPLYTFDGDAIAGDISGHGSGDVWFAVDTDGTLHPADAVAEDAPEAAADDEAAASSIVAVGTTDLGDVLVDSAGLSLYGFTTDADGTPTCDDACADAWPPVLVDNADLPAGLDAATFSVVQRNDGTFQLKAGKWPLYLFAGDGAPGDVNGQGSGDVWFLATPDGSLIGR